MGGRCEIIAPVFDNIGEHLKGSSQLPAPKEVAVRAPDAPDMKDVKGQETAKRVLKSHGWAASFNGNNWRW